MEMNATECEFGFDQKKEIDVLNISSLNLALVGDAVEALYLRTLFAKHTTLNVNLVTKRINKIVNAGAQARSLRLIEKYLTEEELGVCKRARNTHTHSTAKNYSVLDYRRATAFEALLGYLYLTQRHERIDFILNLILTNLDVVTSKVNLQ